MTSCPAIPIAIRICIKSSPNSFAAATATVIAYVLADTVFHLDFTFDPHVWLAGVVLGTVGVGLAGWLGARFVLRQPPLVVLRGNL